MSKKSIVTSILLNRVPAFAAAFFPVGGQALNADGEICMHPNTQTPAFPTVVKIEHARDRFGGGAMVDQPCYVVYFEDAEEKVIVPVNEVCQVTIAVVDSKPVDDVVPNLPEG